MSYQGFYLSHYGIPGQKKGYNKGVRNGKETAQDPESWKTARDSQKIRAKMVNPTGSASIKARRQIIDRKQEVNSLRRDRDRANEKRSIHIKNETRKRRTEMKANITDNKIRKAISERPTIHPRKVKDPRRKAKDTALKLNREYNPVNIAKRKGKQALDYVKKEANPKYGNYLRNATPKTKSKVSVSDLSVRKRTLSRGAKKIQSLVESKTSKKAAPAMMNRKQVSERERERRKKKQRSA